MSDPESTESQQPQTGLNKKVLAIVGAITLFLWVIAIDSGSPIFLGIVGALTLIALGILYWAWRQVNQHKALAALIQDASASPEARQRALETLSADKKRAGKLTHVIARAQLMAAENPGGALELLETVMIKDVPPAMQDDVALLKSQLYLSFGRATDARPLVDRINVDSPQRAENRPVLVAVVAETWARTNSAKAARDLLSTVDDKAIEDDNVRAQVLVAHVFARFAGGNKGAARAALKQLAKIDVNALGRFVAPQFKVHAGLQRLAREEAQRHPQVRKGHPGSNMGRGRPR